MPKKQVSFEGPRAERIKRLLEIQAVLNDWEMNDTLLYFLERGLASDGLLQAGNNAGNGASVPSAT